MLYYIKALPTIPLKRYIQFDGLCLVEGCSGLILRATCILGFTFDWQHIFAEQVPKWKWFAKRSLNKNKVKFDEIMKNMKHMKFHDEEWGFMWFHLQHVSGSAIYV